MGLEYPFLKHDEDERLDPKDYGSILNETGIVLIKDGETFYRLNDAVKFVIKRNNLRFMAFEDETNELNTAVAFFIPAAHQQGGVINVSNPYKGTSQWEVFKSHRGLKKEWNRLKQVILFIQPTYRIGYEGMINYG